MFLRKALTPKSLKWYLVTEFFRNLYCSSICFCFQKKWDQAIVHQGLTGKDYLEPVHHSVMMTQSVGEDRSVATRDVVISVWTLWVCSSLWLNLLILADKGLVVFFFTALTEFNILFKLSLNSDWMTWQALFPKKTKQKENYLSSA